MADGSCLVTTISATRCCRRADALPVKARLALQQIAQRA